MILILFLDSCILLGKENNMDVTMIRIISGLAAVLVLGLIIYRRRRRASSE